mmetsp:Transcript_14257/g.20499  ORF Transcript_14257/g.20499 Transcript_14257/m.20499 type:complete len:510 (+) Transcript_14257:2-1531(+)
MAPTQVMTAGGAGSVNGSMSAKKKKKKSGKKTSTTLVSSESKPQTQTHAQIQEKPASRTPPETSAADGLVLKLESNAAPSEEGNTKAVPESDRADTQTPTPKHNQNQNQKHASTTTIKETDPNSEKQTPVKTLDTLYNQDVQEEDSPLKRNLWLLICFLGIMFSFVCYGLLLEYATSGGRKLHELSFLFVTSLLYTVTAAAGRYVRNEKPTSIPPARFAILGMTSMGSTFCSVRSLRYVIYPIQVLAKSCKPVPVMIMGALMGKKYPLRKYLNVCMIVMGVALFMGGGHEKKGNGNGVDADSASQLVGIVLLFVSLCFDGGTGAYEDKLMAVHHVGPFDLMYNIQLGKTILAGIGLLVLNQVHVFLQMCQDMGFLLIALGLSGALGQVFIFVTIAKFGALTCSIIGLARKVTTLVASILFYGHSLSGTQFSGLLVAVTAMVLNFWGKKASGGGHGHGGSAGDNGQRKGHNEGSTSSEKGEYRDSVEEGADVELQALDEDDEDEGAPLVK